MPIIINGSTLPINPNFTYNGEQVNKVVCRKKCQTCDGDGIEEGVLYGKHCPSCGTDYLPKIVACTTDDCANYGIIGGLDNVYADITCRTCEGEGYEESVVVWERLYTYTLTITYGSGVASVTVERTSSKNPNASIGVLSNGVEIYTGDFLTVSATAQADYELDAYTDNYVVAGDITINITAQTAVLPPILWRGVTYIDRPFGVDLIVTGGFDNPNDVAGTLYYSVNGGSSYSNRSIAANGRYSVNVLLLLPGGSGTIRLRAYLIIDGTKTATIALNESFSN